MDTSDDITLLTGHDLTQQNEQQPLTDCHTDLRYNTQCIFIRYDTRCYFNVRSKADVSQLNLPHGTDK